MIVFNCKICGGKINAEDNASFAECEYCGNTSTLPKINADDEKTANLFNRANHFRRLNEFDKALKAYESILDGDNENAEAHWCVVLSRYGIEYVEDPETRKRIPTCRRVQTESVLTDADYLAALEYAPSPYTKSLYEDEAKKISEIQKGILAISGKEDPYDVFICYKETDDNTGSRTIDSTIAQDIYYQLNNDGYRVFFAKITLEDKLGQEYEPYIFNALNSAKVMLVIGTKPEYFNAVWVKNEWSRYLAITNKDRLRLLIPCYRDMDAYDIPDELSNLQSQDMSKVGFIQDILRGVKKVLDTEKPAAAATVQTTTIAAPGVESLMKRGWLFLEDGDFKQADEYFDRVLDIDAEYAPAYMGKMCAEMKLSQEDDLIPKGKPVGTAIEIYPDIYEKVQAGKKLEAIKLYREKTGVGLKEAKDYIEGPFLTDIVINDAFLPKLMTKAIEVYPDIYEQVKAGNKLEAIKLYREKTGVGLKEAKEYIEGSFLTDVISTPVISNTVMSLSGNNNFKKALRFADKNYRAKLEGYNNAIEEFHIEKERLKQEHIAEQERIREEQRQERILKLKPIRESIAEYAGCISVESKHTVGLKSDGTVVAVGSNEKYDYELKKAVHCGQCNTEGWRNIVAISTGYEYTVGLRADGTVIAVGNNYEYDYELKKAVHCGQCDTDGWRDIVAVSTGYHHTVGLKSDGTVVAVGENESGQCNTGEWQDIIAVYAGGEHTVGLKSDGTVVAVGSNEKYDSELNKTVHCGQCDTGDWRDIVAVSVGYNYTVGLKSDGTVVAVGRNEKEDKELKKEVHCGQCDTSEWRDIVAISANYQHTVGLKSDGTVVAVGDNTRYASALKKQLYCGQCSTYAWHDIVAVSAGENHTVGLKSDGTVVATGDSDCCKTGDWSDIVAVFAGEGYTVGLKSDGTVVAVGKNENGQCNTGDWFGIGPVDEEKLLERIQEEQRIIKQEEKQRQEEERQRREKLILELSKIREKIAKYSGCISLGLSHTVGLRTDGAVVAAGDNRKIGRGKGMERVYCGQGEVEDWRDIIAVSAGDYHTVGLKSDGTVIAAGDNDSGQCKVDNWRDIVAIAAEGSRTVGLKSNGTVVAVGNNLYGECNTDGWRDIIAVSSVDYHTVGLKSNGTVVTVGENKDGQCNIGDWRDIVAIATEYYHTVGLKSDGTVVAVGDNEDGQCNTGDWRDIVAIAVESSRTVGLKSDGTVVAVGENKYGECNTEDWRNIVAIATDSLETIGLRADGTVITTYDGWKKDELSGWRDIVSVTSNTHKVGLKSDGTVVAVGDNYYNECETGGWSDIGPADKNKMLKRAQWESQDLCGYCGGRIGGLFTKKCKSCGKEI